MLENRCEFALRYAFMALKNKNQCVKTGQKSVSKPNNFNLFKLIILL
jgi:hypothetical protein